MLHRVREAMALPQHHQRRRQRSSSAQGRNTRRRISPPEDAFHLSLDSGAPSGSQGPSTGGATASAVIQQRLTQAPLATAAAAPNQDGGPAAAASQARRPTTPQASMLRRAHVATRAECSPAAASLPHVGVPAQTGVASQRAASGASSGAATQPPANGGHPTHSTADSGATQRTTRAVSSITSAQLAAGGGNTVGSTADSGARQPEAGSGHQPLDTDQPLAHAAWLQPMFNLHAEAPMEVRYSLEIIRWAPSPIHNWGQFYA